MEKRTFKHLTETERFMIEKLLVAGESVSRIAEIMGKHRSTIYREINRATYIHTCDRYTKVIEEKRYAPDTAHARYRASLKKKGLPMKILKDKLLMDFIEKQICDEKYSPSAVLMKIKKEHLEFDVEIKAVNTIYNYIKRGVFKNLRMDALPVKKKKHKKSHVKTIKSAPKGQSIEKRPEYVDMREEFGHWEMDCVVGVSGSHKVMLVLIERMTRYMMIELLKRHTAEQVVKALNRIEKEYGSKFFDVFKSVTVDNGHEFNDCEAMEKALYRVGKRTEVYYCHPYSSFERGTNETSNKLIRRHIPKGINFDDKKKKDIKEIENWINEYPRLIFEGAAAGEMYKEEISLLFGAGG